MLRFGDIHTKRVYLGQPVKGIPANVARKAARQLDILAAAAKLEECRFAGRGRIAKLHRSRPPRYYVHVEGIWWIEFEWKLSSALDVRLEER